MLWALKGLGMLHRGTHLGAEQLAGPRLASSLAKMMMMMLAFVSCRASSSWGACEVLVGEGGSLCHDLLREEGRSRVPNGGSVPMAVGSHHPLVRPHAVPGV